jgi:superfamily I DNA/RNA helicase
VHELAEADASTRFSVEQLLADLTPAQVEAVSSDAAPLIVVASAGAGKTRVLTRRIAYRVCTGSADAGHVLALTFTRKAAGEMRDRLHGLGLRGDIAAGTFHSIAAAQLRRWWADRRRSAPALLERKSRLLAPLAAARPALAAVPLADLASVIEWATARMITPDRLAGAVKAHGRSLPGGVSADEVAALFARYEHEKTRRGLIDFDDLLSGCADAMERDPSFAAAQRWRWRHVFVDEFQDLNPLQFRLLLAWMGPGSDLCAVGDPNQAIYGWNGADAGLLSEVAARWPGTEVVSLDDNHRCTPQIVKAAAAVLGSEGSRLSSTRASGPEPIVRGYPSERAEAQGTALAIRRAHLDGRPWSDMAIIARTNAQLVALQEALAAAGVPFWAPSPEAEPADAETTARVAVDVRARGDAGQGGDSVTLCTFHRAKGLEWDAVWVVGLEEGFVPIARAGTGKALEEERRLLYVALTRASRELHCSWARQRSFGGRPIPREPSPWLQLISPPGRAAAGAEPGDDETRIDFWRDRLRAQRQALAAHDPRPGRRPGRARRDSPAWPDPDPEIMADLRLWRSQAARASGVPPYVIFHDVTLSAVASLRPRTHDELLSVPGMGPVKASRYGQTVLEIVAKGPVSA